LKNIFGLGGSGLGCSTLIDPSSAYSDECEREKNNFWSWNLFGGCGVQAPVSYPSMLQPPPFIDIAAPNNE
jgi:hypothetical protein